MEGNVNMVKIRTLLSEKNTKAGIITQNVTNMVKDSGLQTKNSKYLGYSFQTPPLFMKRQKDRTDFLCEEEVSSS